MIHEDTRKYWLGTMRSIADPVLKALETNQLKATLPRVSFGDDRSDCACLEAFARTACGITPWLCAIGLDAEEAALRQRYLHTFVTCLDHATDPDAPDYMNFDRGTQPLVDTAFLAQALFRGKDALLPLLPDATRQNLLAAFRASRKIIPHTNNWILFSAMVEVGIFVLGGEDFDLLRVKYALRQFEQWYKGDGVYGDGPDLHADYYNSFVILPMLVEVHQAFEAIDEEIRGDAPHIAKRAARHAALLERLISPEGTYPIVGRSIAYRFGVFHLLSYAATAGFLPADIAPAQVRCGLTAVIRRTMAHPDSFDDDGWLRHGVCGFQPGLAEGYICTGSLYLCCTAFLPLGLSPDAPFWHNTAADWTAKKVWGGADMARDTSLRG